METQALPEINSYNLYRKEIPEFPLSGSIGIGHIRVPGII